jgi:hypothetical protein
LLEFCTKPFAASSSVPRPMPKAARAMGRIGMADAGSSA